MKEAVEAEVVSVTRSNPITVSTFLDSGRDYFKDLPAKQRERFMESILARQGERDRWLLLLKHKREYHGFSHLKIDKDERPGWGFILEFYIALNKRRASEGGAPLTSFINLLISSMRALELLIYILE